MSTHDFGVRHEQWAKKAAQIITQHQYGDRNRISTNYGRKTTIGITDLIQRCFNDRAKT